MGRHREIKIKHYLYTLRPMLSCQWVLQRNDQPPMSFQDMVQELVPPGSVRDEIANLVQIKMGKRELATIPANRILDEFIIGNFNKLKLLDIPEPVKMTGEPFNATFLNILDLTKEKFPSP